MQVFKPKKCQLFLKAALEMNTCYFHESGLLVKRAAFLTRLDRSLMPKWQKPAHQVLRRALFYCIEPTYLRAILTELIHTVSIQSKHS